MNISTNRNNLISVVDRCIHLNELKYTFFFNDTPPTEIYTLSLHDALPISTTTVVPVTGSIDTISSPSPTRATRSEEHTSELQSHSDLVCRLLLEKKKKSEPKKTQSEPNRKKT